MIKMESKNPGVHAMLLGGIALVAAVFLIIGNLATVQSIADRKHEDLLRSLEIVIPRELHDNDLTTDIATIIDAKGEPRKVYRARKNGAVTAVAFERFVNGYMKIHLIIGIDATGKVLGVRVLAHEETPGLGDKIEVKKSPWIKGFDGLSLSNTPTAKWGVKKDGGLFDQFSGATITPRAIVRAVHEGLEFFSFKKAELLSDRAPVAPAAKNVSNNEGGAPS